jgi:hypothetical protein
VPLSVSDQRWCSDGFEIKCDSGQTVTATFAKDCCDHEILAWRAWEGNGLAGEPVRQNLIEAVEKCFGAVESVPSGHTLEQRLELLAEVVDEATQFCGLVHDEAPSYASGAPILQTISFLSSRRTKAPLIRN